MSNYVIGESSDLFDPDTGNWVGVVDRRGREQVLNPGGALQALVSGYWNSESMTAALLGDSFTARNGLVAGRELDWGYFNWANSFLGRPFRVVLNAGVSGERTDQILARVGTVIAAAPRWCFYRGGINDFAAGRSVAAAAADAQATVLALRNACIRVVVVSLAPNGTYYTKVNAYNRVMRAWCQSNGIVYADTYSATLNPTSATGAFATGNSDDALHLSAQGARRDGKALADAIRPLLPVTNVLVSSASDSYGIDNTSSQLIDNPLMSGTGGTVSGAGASGTLASNWNGGTSTGTVTSVFAAGQARTDGIGVSQRITCSSAGSGSMVNIRQSNMQARVAIGDTLFGSAHIKATGLVDVLSIHLMVQMTIDGQTVYLWGMEPSGTTLADQTDLDMVLATPDLLLAGSAITALIYTIRVQFGTSGAGAATVDIGRAGLFKR